ncbi:MAG: hypothetical protein WA957_16085 [Alteraurantiacibacter sp.]
MNTKRLPAREQAALPTQPYDRWVGNGDETLAEFHRYGDDYLMRFDDLADFVISRDDFSITIAPVPDSDETVLKRTLHNSVLPSIANHTGRLSLHGSAVEFGGHAVAFMGLSRRGKTTLAGACARAGHPFLTEDWVELSGDDQRGYAVLPKQPHLRLFHDSAEYLTAQDTSKPDDGEKVELRASTDLPFADRPCPLKAIFHLGPGDAQDTLIAPVDPPSALVGLLPNAFVLDSHDKPRMRAHFERLGALAATVPSYSLDYPRRFQHLAAVVQAIAEHLEQN